MIPVEQTVTTFPGGNCFAACVASILELPLDAVPNFQSRDWLDEWQEWLRPRNLGLLHFGHREGDDAFIPRGYAILGADSPRGDWLHAVVTCDGVICWDPSPDHQNPVGTWRDWTVFAVLDPTRPVNQSPGGAASGAMAPTIAPTCGYE